MSDHQRIKVVPTLFKEALNNLFLDGSYGKDAQNWYGKRPPNFWTFLWLD